jgi:FtsH-binding integral membrane protein
MEYTQTSMQERLTDFMYKVYGLMGLAFVVTGLTAFYIAKSPALYIPLVTKPGILFLAILVQLLLVISISLLLPKLSFASASILFLLYAVSMGITMSLVFLMYQMSSIYVAFLISAGMFFAMAIYGYVTHADLSQLSSILLMALFGLLIGLFVNMFLQSSKFDIILSTAGVLIFAVLTAYDTQHIKYLGGLMLAEGQDVSKVAVFGALTLYLDFINLFLYLLNLTGKRRD